MSNSQKLLSINRMHYLNKHLHNTVSVQIEPMATSTQTITYFSDWYIVAGTFQYPRVTSILE